MASIAADAMVGSECFDRWPRKAGGGLIPTLVRGEVGAVKAAADAGATALTKWVTLCLSTLSRPHDELEDIGLVWAAGPPHNFPKT